MAVAHPHLIPVATPGKARIGGSFRAAQPETGNQMGGVQMPGMGKELARRPTHRVSQCKYPYKLLDAIGKQGIDLNQIPLRVHAAMT